jgi:hypothetical protein
MGWSYAVGVQCARGIHVLGSPFRHTVQYLSRSKIALCIRSASVNNPQEIPRVGFVAAEKAEAVLQAELVFRAVVTFAFAFHPSPLQEQVHYTLGMEISGAGVSIGPRHQKSIS